MSVPIIETRGLSKAYGAHAALSDVTIDVPPGAIGLLGPNGAGKTTLLKCLLNFTYGRRRARAWARDPPGRIGSGRMLDHDRIAALKQRHRRVVELAPSGEPERFLAALGSAGVAVERLPNGRLRIESPGESANWILTLLRDHRLPPAEIVANPNALHDSSSGP